MISVSITTLLVVVNPLAASASVVTAAVVNEPRVSASTEVMVPVRVKLVSAPDSIVTTAPLLTVILVIVLAAVVEAWFLSEIVTAPLTIPIRPIAAVSTSV